MVDGVRSPTARSTPVYNEPDGPWLTMFHRAVLDGEIEAAMSRAQESFDRIHPWSLWPRSFCPRRGPCGRSRRYARLRIKPQGAIL